MTIKQYTRFWLQPCLKRNETIQSTQTIWLFTIASLRIPPPVGVVCRDGKQYDAICRTRQTRTLKRHLSFGFTISKWTEIISHLYIQTTNYPSINYVPVKTLNVPWCSERNKLPGFADAHPPKKSCNEFQPHPPTASSPHTAMAHQMRWPVICIL